MKKLDVLSLPLAVNVCGQMLREIDRNDEMSVAHVVMNPEAASRLHVHNKTHEIYIITRGNGDLQLDYLSVQISSGSVIHIPPRTKHRLTNTAMTSLEHLVLAFPPFDPNDVEIREEKSTPTTTAVPEKHHPVVECFDGARISSYDFPEMVSIAFGRVIADPKRRKRPHFHKNTKEWIYVVEGNGAIDNGQGTRSIQSHSWITIEPGERHALRNFSTQDMVVVCICTPPFDIEDVHYD